MRTNSAKDPFELLLVEDNPADVMLMEEALKESGIAVHLQVAANGDQAMDFLRRRGPYREAPRPDLVMLDLNLPKKDGREVLAEIKGDPELVSIPVIVITTSGAEEDILQSYRLHANCYIVKPVGLKKFFEVIRAIEYFWLTIVKLPPGKGEQ